MVDIKREDITLQDWTKGISADEFAGGSYFYSEAISSGYNSKGFELGNYLKKWALNSRKGGYAVSITESDYGFMAFTRDGRIETEDFWNGASDGTGDSNRGGAIYSFYKGGYQGDGYLNGLKYRDYAIGIRADCIDVVDYKQAFTPTSEKLSNTDLSSSTGWTFGTGWTATAEGAAHTTGTTGTLTANISGAGIGADDYCRLAMRIKGWTAGNISATIGFNTEISVTNDRANGWLVFNLKGKASTTTLTITPSSTFNGTIEIVNLHKYDSTYVFTAKADIDGRSEHDRLPALIWEGDLYVGCGHMVNIINLSDRGATSKALVDKDYEIVAMNQQAGNIIIWATNGYDSRQYYWNGVDNVATEVIEWKGLIIQSACGTETISYVLTTSGATSGTVEGYEYRLYAVSGYQRNLIASKLFQYGSGDYLEAPHYNENKKFDFNDVTNDKGMIVFLDSLYIPGCDGAYKYGYDVPGLRSAWTRPIKYDTSSTNIVMGQRGNYLGIAFTSGGVNYIGNVDNRLYQPTGYLISESIYRDKLSTRKALEKLKIGYKNVASTVGNIKVYAIVDDNYFRRFRPTTTPTVRPSVGDVYQVADDTTAKVIDVDQDNNVITLVTVSNTGSKQGLAETTLTKVSGDGDNSIIVGYNFDNMCHIKTIESEQQGYDSDLIFGKNFVANYIPYWHKIQFVIELNSNDNMLSPEIYEISMVSDITDTVL